MKTRKAFITNIEIYIEKKKCCVYIYLVVYDFFFSSLIFQEFVTYLIAPQQSRAAMCGDFKFLCLHISRQQFHLKSKLLPLKSEARERRL